MSKAEKTANFDPNGVGLKNGHFIGLPYEEEESDLVMLSVPWDVTVSFGAGTAGGPENVLACSSQLDLFDVDLDRPWAMGIYLRRPEAHWQQRNAQLRTKALAYIDWLEAGSPKGQREQMEANRQQVNQGCTELHEWIYREAKGLLEQGKIVGLLGGEHSTPLGLIRALSERYPAFGILQIDAHQDLRIAYEGFPYSHASIFHNALQFPQVTRLVQVGIRDNCEAEAQYAAQNNKRIKVFYDRKLKAAQFHKQSWISITRSIVAMLPRKVYISFDIDGLNPSLCPNTGTPVPGGLQYNEAIALIKAVVDSGREIIGFDLCEVAGEGEWDGNVAARLLYQLCGWTGCSQGKVSRNG
ncbi:MAG: agmatinase family protein [Bacteroidota bacterium]